MITKLEDFLNSLVYVLVSPKLLANQLKKNLKIFFWFSFLIPLSVIFFDLIAFNLLGEIKYFPYHFLGYKFVFLLLIYLLTTLVTVALLDSFWQIGGQKGRYLELVSIINLSTFPKIFILPLMSFFMVLGLRSGWLYFIFSIGFFVWSLIIVIKNFSRIYKISYGNALFFFFLPKIFIIGMLLIILGIGIVYLFNLVVSQNILSNFHLNLSMAPLIFFRPWRIFSSEVAKDIRI